MYHHVFIAGTFDGLHIGHQAVLSRAFSEGEKVTVGITTDEFVAKYKALNVSRVTYHVSRQEERRNKVDEWVKVHGWIDKVTFIDINDPYEPAASGEYDAIVVTSQNEHTAKKINEMRHEKSLPALTLIMVALVPAQDEVTISSTRMRNHEIDAWGTLLLPDNVRPELKDPLGDIVKITDILPEIQASTGKLITVGDLTTDRMLINGIVPDLSIIDLHVRRQPYKKLHEFNFPRDVTTVHIKSGPGNISQDALTFLSKWTRTTTMAGKKFALVICGEDDLLVLPAIYFAPIGTIVLYGQPNQGIVRLVVTPQLQQKAKEYLQKFTKE
jgi:GTP-dependent dephospho-CoA kinase